MFAHLHKVVVGTSNNLRSAFVVGDAVHRVFVASKGTLMLEARSAHPVPRVLKLLGRSHVPTKILLSLDVGQNISLRFVIPTLGGGMGFTGIFEREKVTVGVVTGFLHLLLGVSKGLYLQPLLYSLDLEIVVKGLEYKGLQARIS